jgi:hypothetical protein
VFYRQSKLKLYQLSIREAILQLSDVFPTAALKVLSAVDLPDQGSNQHELNGVLALREFFGEERVKGPINWFYFSDDEDSPLSESGHFTFYDSRANHPTRTEWRMYYSGFFLARASIGDLLVLAKDIKGDIYGLVFERTSSWTGAVLALFDFETSDLPDKGFRSIDNLGTTTLEFVRQRILEELGFEPSIPVHPNDETLVVERFGSRFPAAREMSALARSLLGTFTDDPDELLIAWLAREEELFRSLERHIVQERLEMGFSDVDEFISYSLSVQNRRKSRMGLALENHLAAVFSHQQLRFAQQAVTEGRKKPDFIFPGRAEYHDISFPENRLALLGAKSSCKERWRQILTEANRISWKHLCTLEPGISQYQLNEMTTHDVTLVVPREIQMSYSGIQADTIWSLDRFVAFVRDMQR